jgi:hypothetical protein
VDEEGRPVAGGVVESWGLGGSLGLSDETSGLAIPGEECLLFASADGFLPRLVRCPAGAEPVDVVMRSSRSIVLTVASADNPSVGLKVRIRSADPGVPVLCDDPIARQWAQSDRQTRGLMLADLWGRDLQPIVSQASVESRTDAHGQARLAFSARTILVEVASGSLAAFSREVVFERRGSTAVSAPYRMVTNEAAVVVELQRSGSMVKGRIELGAVSVKGSCVLRFEQSNGSGITIQDIEQQVQLREDGSFEFDSVAPGAKTVVVSARLRAEELVFAVAAVQVEPGRVHDLGALVPEPGSLDVEVELLDASSAPVAAPECRWRLIVGTNPLTGPVLAEAVGRLASAQTLRIRGLPSGLVSVEAALDMDAQLPAGMRLFDESRLRCEQPVTPSASVRLEGRVSRFLPTEFSTPTRLSGAAAWQGSLVDVELGVDRGFFASRLDGSVVVAVVDLPQELRSYRYELHREHGSAGEYAIGSMDIAGGSKLQIEPKVAAAVRGVVRSRSQASKVVRVVAESGSGWRAAEVRPDGSFALRGLVPGVPYRMKAWDDRAGLLAFVGFADGLVPVTAGAAGEILDLGNLEVESSAK